MTPHLLSHHSAESIKNLRMVFSLKLVTIATTEGAG